MTNFSKYVKCPIFWAIFVHIWAKIFSTQIGLCQFSIFSLLTSWQKSEKTKEPITKEEIIGPIQ